MAPATASGGGSGQGLVGLRERVGVYGGVLEAGARPDGGYRVAGATPAAGAVIRVLLADDQSLVRAGFRMILRAEPDIEVVGEAADGREAIDRARELRPDVVLMDIRMPGSTASRRRGNAALEPAPRVLVLTTFDLDEYVYESLRAGASAFLLKDVPEQQLLAAVRVVADGGSLFAPSVTRRLVEQFARPAAPAAPALAELTAREQSKCSGWWRAGARMRRSPRELVVSEHTAKTHVASVAPQARPAQSRAGGRARLRDRPRTPRRTPAAAAGLSPWKRPTKER